MNHTPNISNIPSIRLEVHKEWERLYNCAWELHKGNIKKASHLLNPSAYPDFVSYVDEAFDEKIYQWDTLFMMLFNQFAYHEFPTLQSMDNFYYNQYDYGAAQSKFVSKEMDGFISRMINEDDGKPWPASYAESTHLDSVNPPLFGWAEWEQYMVHGDISRFTTSIQRTAPNIGDTLGEKLDDCTPFAQLEKTVLERLDAYFQFIWRNRMNDNGLLRSSGQANGMDNTPAHWLSPANQTWVCINIQMYQFAGYILKIAYAAGHASIAARYEKIIAEFGPNIMNLLWCPKTNFYHNLDHRPDSGEQFLKDSHGDLIYTPVGFWALAAGLLSKEQAKEMVKRYAHNSEMLFRPGGLASLAYQNKDFEPGGGYWLGAFWAPTSYMYIRGLKHMGFGNWAFMEAVRHAGTLSRVLEKGAYDRNGELLHTLWENYSTEWDLPGMTEHKPPMPSRADFVGWTGALAVGTLIQDIIGITLNAPQNSVHWSLRLTEEHGIDKLWMAGNVFSMYAKSRLTATSPAVVTVDALAPFTLHITNGDSHQSFDVQSGKNIFNIGGVHSGEGAYLVGSINNLGDADVAALIKQSSSHVLFGSTANPHINDGLCNQKGKNINKDIFNVNTIGYRNAALRQSRSLSALLSENVLEYIKTGAKDGFMAMAAANDTLKTIRLVIGVANAAATIYAELSDAAACPFMRSVVSEGGEKEFVAEISFRASSDDDNYILIKYVIDDVKCGAEGYVTLKALIL